MKPFEAFCKRAYPSLLLRLENSVRNTLKRFLLVATATLVMGHFNSVRLAAVVILLFALHDALLIVALRRLRRGYSYGDVAWLAAVNTVISVIYGGYFYHTTVSAQDPVAVYGGLLVLIVSLTELNSSEAENHPFPFLAMTPILMAIIAAVTHLVFAAETSFLSKLVVAGLLALASPYTVSIFVKNARHLKALERETRRANRANAQKSRFLADMSHEIRTPLHAVFGTAQLLQTTRDPAEVRRLSGILLTASSDLKAIVDDVIDLSRAEEGRIELRPEPADPAELARQAVGLFDAGARQKGLQLDLVVAPDLPRAVMLDPVRVGQVLTNLLSNAVKYTVGGTVRLSVVVVPADAGRELRFVVKDTGPGIPFSEHAAIFQPYRQLAASRSAAQRGAGLGLAICRRLAERMNGRISLVSRPAEGAQFTLHLPLVPVDERDLPQPAAPEPAAPPDAPQARPALAGLKVLVVDDSDINRTVFGAMLHSLGASVAEAASGSGALDLLDLTAVDAILLDNSMPGMNGTEMLARLRARDDATAGLPVLCVSAGVTPEEVKRYEALGVAGFLAKPIAIPALAAALRRAVSEQAG